MRKKTIAIISTRDLDKAPRIHREIEALKDDFNIVFFGESESNLKSIRYFNIYKQRNLADKIINKLSRLLNFTPRFSKLKSKTKSLNISAFIIHEANFLPVITKLKKQGVKAIFNAHEYHPLEFENRPGWNEKEGRIQDDLYRKYLNQLSLLINVSRGIKDKCLSTYNTDSIVIPNAPYQYNMEPVKNKSNVIRLVHHGVLLPARKIELMIDALEIIGDNYSLDIYGVESKDHHDYFKLLSYKADQLDNVRLLNPVPFEKIIPTMNKYDLGLVIIPPENFNYKFCLPNKFFEYIQARIGIIIGPTADMATILNKYHIGEIVKDFTPESLAELLLKISPEKINTFKNNSAQAAEQENAEYYQGIFLNSIKSLFQNN